MLSYTVIACLCVLLVSNLWLLKEIERIRKRLEVYQREMLSLDDRVFRLTIDLKGVMAEQDSDTPAATAQSAE